MCLSLGSVLRAEPIGPEALVVDSTLVKALI